MVTMKHDLEAHKKDQTKEKPSLFNHGKRINELELQVHDLTTPNKLDVFLQRYGAVCSIWTFIIILVLWIFPSLR